MENNTMELIKKLAKCQAACNHCFNACLQEEDVKMMADCIRLDKECSEICGLALSLVASDACMKKDVLQVCAKICEKCAEECGKHNNDHCRMCAEACRECAETCKSFN